MALRFLPDLSQVSHTTTTRRCTAACRVAHGSRCLWPSVRLTMSGVRRLHLRRPRVRDGRRGVGEDAEVNSEPGFGGRRHICPTIFRERGSRCRCPPHTQHALSPFYNSRRRHSAQADTSQTRQTPEPVALNASSPSDKEIFSKNGKETEPPATMTSTSTTTTTSKSAPSSAAPNAASPAHAPTLALLNGEGTPSHKHSSSLPTSSILFTPPHSTVPAPSAGPALTKTPSPESQPPSARSSTIVVSPSLPSNLANLSVAEDVSRRSSFRHMFRRTSKDPKDKRTPKRHWGHHAKCPEKCADTHSSRDFSDGEDMSPTSLDSSIDYESAFKAVMLENMKLREEIVELRRRASLPVTTLTGTTLNGTINEHKRQDSYDVNTSAPSALGLEVHSGPPETLETSVRELTNAIRAVPGRILVIVLIAGFVSIIRSWKFDSCVYVV